jgi:hypothetical protein
MMRHRSDLPPIDSKASAFEPQGAAVEAQSD